MCRRSSQDLNLSLDDQSLYVSCWGTGELQQYDVSDPFSPKLTGSVKIGGMVRRAPHTGKPDTALNGGPQMVEISRDGRRVYVTNSLYSTWDDQFYPDGIRGWMAKIDVGETGGIRLDQNFLLEFDGMRPIKSASMVGTLLRIPTATRGEVWKVDTRRLLNSVQENRRGSAAPGMVQPRSHPGNRRDSQRDLNRCRRTATWMKGIQ